MISKHCGASYELEESGSDPQCTLDYRQIRLFENTFVAVGKSWELGVRLYLTITPHKSLDE